MEADELEQLVPPFIGLLEHGGRQVLVEKRNAVSHVLDGPHVGGIIVKRHEIDFQGIPVGARPVAQDVGVLVIQVPID